MLRILGTRGGARLAAALNKSTVHIVSVTTSSSLHRLDHVQSHGVAWCSQNLILKRGLAEIRYVQAAAATAPSSSLPEIPSSSPAISSVDPLPEAPLPLPEELLADDVLPDILNALGEPTLQSMGLGSWWPPGLIQQSLEFLHVSLHLPWWASIVLGTMVLRVLMFPIVVKVQKNNALMNNNMPQLQVIQAKMAKAKASGNHYDAARYSHEMVTYMKETGMNPIKNMVWPLVQAPVFISCFLGLRAMANYPVESMMTGGAFWFVDLTLPDQYYLLPILTSLTLYATIEIGADGARMAQNQTMLKYFMRGLPLIMIPFTVSFPSAILCYWFSSNAISLLQVGVLKIPAVREYLQIPKLIKPNPELVGPKKGFKKTFSETWRNFRLSRDVNDRAEVDEMLFNKAGKGPVVKTYKFDPTKVIHGIDAKKRNT